MSTSLQTVMDLDERNHIIELKFRLTVEWFEYRATYQNLKTNKALNVLSSEELREIWIPFIIFKVYNWMVIRSTFHIPQKNTDFNEVVSLDVFDSTVFVNREGDFTRADIFSVDEVEIFEGRENRITMVQTYSKKFHCTYLLHDYPFDTQVSLS